MPQYQVSCVLFPYYITLNLTSLLIFQQGVNVSANLALNIYGVDPVNITIDLCNLFNGALCPLPMYNFTGADTLTLPPSLAIPDIPAIVYKIPDLEGFFQLILTEVETGVVTACIQATISNGWSAHQPAVEWATGGIALAALLLAGWYSFASPEATFPFRFLELIYLYQSIASSSFLSLNYPSVYRAFSLNFAWAVGLIPSSTIQNSINRMRHLTGGNLADATDVSAVGFVNRKLSPYDDPDVLTELLLRKLTTPFARFSSFSDIVPPLRVATTGEVQVVTAESSNVLQAGVPISVNTIHIATANAFMTVFIFVLCMFAIAAIIFMMGHGSLFALDRIRGRRNNRESSVASHPFSCKSLSFVRAWSLRLVRISSVFTIVNPTANLQRFRSFWQLSLSSFLFSINGHSRIHGFPFFSPFLPSLQSQASLHIQHSRFFESYVENHHHLLSTHTMDCTSLGMGRYTPNIVPLDTFSSLFSWPAPSFGLL